MTSRKANYDLLRVLAMLGIILFHHFGNYTPNHFAALTDGFDYDHYFYDFINNTPAIPGSVSKLTLLMDFCYGHFGNGGNYIFMLFTGYFLFGRDVSIPKRLQKAGKVLYAIFFYGIILTLVHFAAMKLFFPFSCYPSYRPLFTLPNWLSGENLWYLQAYGLFLIVILPLLKLFENKLTRQKHLYLALVLIFIRFLAYSKYLPNLWLSSRMLDFIMWYYIGGYLSRYAVALSGKKTVLLALSYLMVYFLYEYYWRYSCGIEYEPADYSYISVMQPFVCCLLFALLAFFLFDHLKLRSARLSRLLGTLSSATIGIYIFHYNVITLSFLLGNSYWWHDWSRRGYFLFAILDSILLFAIGFVLDLFRQKSFARVEAAITKHFFHGTEGACPS